MRWIHSLPVLASAGALLACAESGQPTAPTALVPPAVATALRAALADADARLLPALADAVRAPLGAAIAELRAALDAGDAARMGRAVVAARSALSRHGALARAGAGEASDDDADLAAVAILVDLATSAANGAARGAPP